MQIATATRIIDLINSGGSFINYPPRALPTIVRT